MKLFIHVRLHLPYDFFMRLTKHHISYTQNVHMVKQAQRALIQAIYTLDRNVKVPQQILEADTKMHVEAASKHQRGLVPLALLLLLTDDVSDDKNTPLSVCAAQMQLSKTPCLRMLLEKILSKKSKG